MNRNDTYFLLNILNLKLIPYDLVKIPDIAIHCIYFLMDI